MASIGQIANAEAGSSVRTKLNSVIDAVNVVGNAQTGTTYTVVATDDLDLVTLSNAAAITVTLPSTMAVGFSATFIQLGAGVATFAAGSGATRNSRGAVYSTAGQYAVVTALVITNAGGSAASWVLTGDLV